MRRFTSIFVQTPDFGQHTEITLQGVLNRDYTLGLFIENEELNLQTQDNRTWTPAQRLYVPCFFTTHTSRCQCMCRGFSSTSEMRTEIQMRSGKLFWAKTRLASEVIDLQALFNGYWSSNKHEFTVPRKSPTPNIHQYLMVNHRGHYCQWKAPPAYLVSRITILYNHYRSSLSNGPFQPANSPRIDGISALVAP